MMRTPLKSRMIRFLSALSAVPWASLGDALAQPLEDVSLEYQDRGIVATIRMSGPVQYLRHYPESHGKTLEIYYDRVLDATSTEAWQDNEVRHSPPSGLIPGFSVTTRNQELKCDQQAPRDQMARDQVSKCDQLTKPKLVIEFSREAEYSVTPGKDNRSLLIIIRPEKRPVGSGPLPVLPTVKAEPLPAPADVLAAEAANLAENNERARALMIQGRDALESKNNEAAVDVFNKLLLLPPNDYTQDGQEWVGVARERVGQIDKARIEYELYLRLYPEGEGVARVAQRLAGLSGQVAGPQAAEASPEGKKCSERRLTYGNISSRYYHGHSKVESFYTYNNEPATSSQSLTDQSMLVTSIDASERYVSEDYDGRLVFRDVYTKNYLADQYSQNRMSAAYGEVRNRTRDYMIRVGRQSSSGGGVLGRFTGVSGSYGMDRDMRVNGVVGAMGDFSSGSQPVFAGVSMDNGPLSLYAIGQRVDSATDRRAVGTEYRYFKDNKTAFALLDYDAYFKALNAAQFMGTIGALGGTVNFMVDHRKNPSLSIRNALNGAGTSSVDTLLQTMSASSLRGLALARTATSSMGQVGITLPLRGKWQAGGDFRLTNTTGLPASGRNAIEGILPGTPSRGTEQSVTGQLTGSGLLLDGDIWSGSITINTGSAVNGRTYYFYNHTQFLNGWAIDPSLQLYRAKDQFGSDTRRNSPMVRGAYRLKEQLFIDMDGGFEFVKLSGAQQITKTKRYFYSAGFRWDF